MPGEAIKLARKSDSDVDVLPLPPKLKQKLKDYRSKFLPTYIHASIVFNVHVEWVGLVVKHSPEACHLAWTYTKMQQTVMFPFHSVKAEYVLSHSLLHLHFACTRTRWACLPMCQLACFLLTMVFYVIIYYCPIYVIKLLTLRERAKGEPLNSELVSHINPAGSVSDL